MLRLKSKLGDKTEENCEKLVAQQVQEIELKQMDREENEEVIGDKKGDEEKNETAETESADKSDEKVEMEVAASLANRDQDETNASDYIDSESINVDLVVTNDPTAKSQKRKISMYDVGAKYERSQPTIINGKISQNSPIYLVLDLVFVLFISFAKFILRYLQLKAMIEPQKNS